MEDFVLSTFGEAKFEIVRDVKYSPEEVRLIPSTLKNYSSEKCQRLLRYVQHNAGLPQQGSAEWLEARTFSVGGSEIAAITGNNKNMKVSDLIASKAGTKEFKKNHFMLWGTMFENMVRRTVEMIKNTEIVELGSIRGKYGNSYSPDGIAYDPKNDKVILYEFKCPYSRMPNGEVPAHYKDQVLLGMDTIKLCEESRYIEAVIRRCSFDSIGFTPEHDTIIHKVQEEGIPFAYGFIGFFSSIVHYRTPIDIGSCADNVWKSIMYNVINNAMDYYQFEPIVNPKYSQVENKETFFQQYNRFVEFCTNRGLCNIGIMPYKIYPFKAHIIRPEPGFAKNLSGKIAEVLAEVKKMKESNCASGAASTSSTSSSTATPYKRTYRKKT